MFIDKEYHVMTEDNALDGITFDEVITTAHCNGESIRRAFERILKIRIEDARYMINKYEAELEAMK